MEGSDQFVYLAEEIFKQSLKVPPSFSLLLTVKCERGERNYMRN